ncbi:MAG: CtsR family transcriptional regulator, partial [Streptococcaceae bacterium]|nr:CtsR family transcriptional regulator [Streptococcaceae bacterium]
MANNSDKIEEYIKRLFKDEDAIEIQRRDMAHLFDVVPSQINYVINTRFTRPKGYTVESKRGGGGYIRIVKITFSDIHDYLVRIKQFVGGEITEVEANQLIQRLFEEG